MTHRWMTLRHPAVGDSRWADQEPSTDAQVSGLAEVQVELEPLGDRRHQRPITDASPGGSVGEPPTGVTWCLQGAVRGATGFSTGFYIAEVGCARCIQRDSTVHRCTVTPSRGRGGGAQGGTPLGIPGVRFGQTPQVTGCKGAKVQRRQTHEGMGTVGARILGPPSEGLQGPEALADPPTGPVRGLRGYPTNVSHK